MGKEYEYTVEQDRNKATRRLTESLLAIPNSQVQQTKEGEIFIPVQGEGLGSNAHIKLSKLLEIDIPHGQSGDVKGGGKKPQMLDAVFSRDEAVDMLVQLFKTQLPKGPIHIVHLDRVLRAVKGGQLFDSEEEIGAGVELKFLKDGAALTYYNYNPKPKGQSEPEKTTNQFEGILIKGGFEEKVLSKELLAELYDINPDLVRALKKKYEESRAEYGDPLETNFRLQDYLSICDQYGLSKDRAYRINEGSNVMAQYRRLVNRGKEVDSIVIGRRGLRHTVSGDRLNAVAKNDDAHRDAVGKLRLAFARANPRPESKNALPEEYVTEVGNNTDGVNAWVFQGMIMTKESGPS